MAQRQFFTRIAPRSGLIAGYVSAMMVLLIGGLVFYCSARIVAVYSDVFETRQLVTVVRQLTDQAYIAEAASREYQATGADSALVPYRRAMVAEPVLLARLRVLGSAHPAYSARIDTLAYYSRLRFAELDQSTRIRSEKLNLNAVAPVIIGRPEHTMQQFQRISSLLSAEVDAQNLRAWFEVKQELARAIGVAIAGAACALLLLVIFTLVYRRQIEYRDWVFDELTEQSAAIQHHAEEVKLANEELEITTREMVQQTAEAEANQLRLSGILSSATDAIISFDDDRRIVYINAAAERMFGVRAREVVGTEIMRFVAPEHQDAFSSYISAARFHLPALADEVKRWQVDAVRADHSEIPVEASIAYAQATERQGLYTAILRDVSSRQQLEEQLRQSQKMEAVGRLAGGVAHDFNNLLTVIGASSDFILQSKTLDPDSIREDILEIRKATDRAAALTRQLLAFSRRQLINPQLTDLNGVVDEMRSMLQRLIGEDIKLETYYEEGLGSVRIDRGQLEQVVANLAVNARDAMPQGGTLEIRTETARPNEYASLAADGDGSNGFVVLSVKDTGVGMDRSTQAQIFEPFFTTKEHGKGTGLGLPTVYGIVKQAGGDVVVDSEPGYGSELRLYFPKAAEESVADMPIVERPSRLLSGSETVLIVEDEDSLRHLAHRILESRGYKVLDAANGQDAIEVMARHGGKVDLVVSDVVMPVMGGRELVERLLPVYPLLRILFMTGYTEDTLLKHRIAEFGIAVLEKPFTPETLAKAVRSTLDRARGHRPHVPESRTA